MILSSKAISVHICSKLCMVAFLSSISARYFHTIGVSSMFDAHFSCNYQHAPKDRKVTRHINVLFISKCIFPPFLQHTRKDRKIRPGPPVSRRRTFLSFPGLLYIYIYNYTYIYIYTYLITNTYQYYNLGLLRNDYSGDGTARIRTSNEPTGNQSYPIICVNINISSEYTSK